MAAVDVQRWQGGRGLMMGALVAGVVGLGIAGAGMASDPVIGFRAYLVGFLYWLGIVLGSMAFLLVCHATKAKWMTVLRRHMETMAASLPIFIVLFIPVLLGLGKLFIWVAPPAHLDHHELDLLRHKAPYLNQGFFLVRVAIYFGAWLLISQVLRARSLTQDGASDGEAMLRKLRNFSPGMLPVAALTLTFAAFDWIMSLEPFWFSTIFGAYYFAAGFVSFFALLAIVAHRARGKDLPGEQVSLAHFHNIGKLMFAFSCFWGYMGFSQYMLIWVANLPDETAYFLLRREGPWLYVGALLILGHFFIPFFMLIGRKFKLQMKWLMALSVWLLVMNFVDMFWLVMPSAKLVAPEHDMSWPSALLFSVAATVGVGGIATAFALMRARGNFTIPVKDPFLADSIEYQQP